MTQIINTLDIDSLDGFSRGGQKADFLRVQTSRTCFVSAVLNLIERCSISLIQPEYMKKKRLT